MFTPKIKTLLPNVKSDIGKYWQILTDRHKHTHFQHRSLFFQTQLYLRSKNKIQLSVRSTTHKARLYFSLYQLFKQASYLFISQLYPKQTLGSFSWNTHPQLFFTLSFEMMPSQWGKMQVFNLFCFLKSWQYILRSTCLTADLTRYKKRRENNCHTKTEIARVFFKVVV